MIRAFTDLKEKQKSYQISVDEGVNSKSMMAVLKQDNNLNFVYKSQIMMINKFETLKSTLNLQIFPVMHFKYEV